ncbi:PqqD family peptide modification chaperone [Anaerosporobacter sp.]
MNGKIKLIKHPEISELAGEKVMIDFESGKYFMLKGAANDIWDLMQYDITVIGIIEKLLEIYDVDRETCESSVQDFLQNLVEKDFISIESC